ncbi:MAG TPA: hypothetical protein VFZ66_01480 [Herpetosiphonaceae bacterium]
MEAWRTAATRWGDTVFELALLLTNQRAAAEAATVAAFCRVFSGATGAEAEQALYHALITERQRWRQPLRNRVLPRALARIEPLDRALLGLWLLRHVDGERLAAIVGQTPQAMIARLTTLLTRTTNIPLADTQPDGAHLTLGTWLEAELGLHTQPMAHLRTCARCRAAQTSWQNAIATLRGMLQETLKKEHLPPACIDAIEDALIARQAAEPQRWWQQRRVWIPAFFLSIGLVVALLVVPWGNRIAQQAAAPATARALVQETIDGWMSAPVSDTLHRQVWAIDPRLQSAEPLITDLWLSGAAPEHYRVEVRYNNRLVEWQLGDGKGRLSYAGEPSYSSCPWRTDASAQFRMLDQAALTFRVTPEQQRAAREARLSQGAYGLGYGALRQALVADDLRSFGTRQEQQRSLVVLGYTDRQAEPARQILLRIDPVSRQLYGVQEVALGGGQTKTRDLWRLQAQEQIETSIPAHLPRWPQSVTREQLFDAACPALNPQHVVSLSTLVGDSQQWYLPREMPPDTSRAAMLTLNPIVAYIDYTPLGVPRGSVATFLGNDRWLTISDLDWHPGAATVKQIARGPWLVDVAAQPRPGIWSARLRPARERDNKFSPTIALYAGGWSEAELLDVIDTLQLFDPQIWIALDAGFLDARPLPQPVHDSIRRAFIALQPQPDSALYSATKTVVRVNPESTHLSDPYQIAAAQRSPESLIRKQWQIYADGQLSGFRDLRALPDDTPYALIASDGSQFKVYMSVDGRLYTGDAAVLPLKPQQPGVEMVRSLLRANEPITILDQDGAWVLQQSSPYRFVTLSFEFNSPGLQQTPWTEGLIDGVIVRRLWLDRETFMPKAFALFHRSPQGQETPLVSTTIIERGAVAAPAKDALLELSPLPADTLTMQVTAVRETAIDTSMYPPVRRVLAWPASPEVAVGEPPQQRGSRTQLSNSGLWQQRWDSFVPSDIWHQRIYRFPPDDLPITITQGPHDLMRHILRYQTSVQSWSSSRAIPVTIAGESQTAWLLSNDNAAALVIEVDDLLVHIAGPIGYLQGPLIDRLPNLVWTPVQP